MCADFNHRVKHIVVQPFLLSVEVNGRDEGGRARRTDGVEPRPLSRTPVPRMHVPPTNRWAALQGGPNGQTRHGIFVLKASVTLSVSWAGRRIQPQLGASNIARRFCRDDAEPKPNGVCR